MHELAKAVAARPPAPGSPEEEDFFGHPRHMAARMIRDILTGNEEAVRERILDIMPHIVQARRGGRALSCPVSAAYWMGTSALRGHTAMCASGHYKCWAL